MITPTVEYKIPSFYSESLINPSELLHRRFQVLHYLQGKRIGSGRLSESSGLSSFIQKISRFNLSLFTNSSYEKVLIPPISMNCVYQTDRIHHQEFWIPLIFLIRCISDPVVSDSCSYPTPLVFPT